MIIELRIFFIIQNATSNMLRMLIPVKSPRVPPEDINFETFIAKNMGRKLQYNIPDNTFFYELCTTSIAFVS